LQSNINKFAPFCTASLILHAACKAPLPFPTRKTTYFGGRTGSPADRAKRYPVLGNDLTRALRNTCRAKLAETRG
jgi:hypothetical protein